jgi:hypothetical protein
MTYFIKTKKPFINLDFEVESIKAEIKTNFASALKLAFKNAALGCVLNNYRSPRVEQKPL